MKNRKIAIFVQSAGIEPWKSIEDLGQKETFVKNIQDNQIVYWYQGWLERKYNFEYIASKYFHKSYKIFWTGKKFENRLHVRRLNRQKTQGVISKLYNKVYSHRFQTSPSEFDQQILQFPVSGEFGATGLRVAMSINYFLKYTDADFMLRTNSTSYINLKRLNKYLSQLPDTKVYAGVPLKLGKIPFMSGAANIISRDVAEGVICRKHLWNHEYPEDVALGKMISDYSLANNFEFGCITNIDHSKINFVEIDSHKDIFHFRCKTGESEETIKIMKSIDQHFEKQANYNK